MRTPLVVALGLALLGVFGIVVPIGADDALDGQVDGRADGRAGDRDEDRIEGAGGADVARAVALHAHPHTCVAMRRGNVCYQDVELVWTGTGPGAFCLHRAATDEALACWRDRERERHVHRYASESSERYELRREGAATALATATVGTAWVYRNRRRVLSGWRLF